MHLVESTQAVRALEAWSRALFSSIDSKNAATFVEFLCEDVVFRYGSGAEVSGRAATRSLVGAVFSRFLSCEHEVLHVWSVGEWRIFEGVVTYTKHDKEQLALPFCNVLVMRGELIEKYQIYIDPTPLLTC